MYLLLHLYLLFFDRYEYYGGSGESIWTKFWFQLLASVLTFGGALFVAYKAFKWNKKKEEKIRQTEKTDNEFALIRYLKTSLELNLPAVAEQSKVLSELLIDLKENEKQSTFHYYKTIGLQFEWIDKLDPVSLKDVFFKYVSGTETDKTILYNDLIKHSAFFNEFNKMFESDLNRHIKDLFNQEENFKNNYLAFKSIIVDFLNSNPYPEIKTDLNIGLTNIINAYASQLNDGIETRTKINKFITDISTFLLSLQTNLWRFELNHIQYISNDFEEKYDNLIGLLSFYVDSFGTAKSKIKVLISKLSEVNP